MCQYFNVLYFTEVVFLKINIFTDIVYCIKLEKVSLNTW